MRRKAPLYYLTRIPAYPTKFRPIQARLPLVSLSLAAAAAVRVRLRHGTRDRPAETVASTVVTINLPVSELSDRVSALAV